jgi:hypothetical protein
MNTLVSNYLVVFLDLIYFQASCFGSLIRRFFGVNHDDNFAVGLNLTE